jgi:hypothetical protein
MADVLPLSRAPAPPEAEARLYRRIRLGSRGLAWLFAGLAMTYAAFVAVLMVGVIAYHGPNLRIGPTGVWLGTGDLAPSGSIPFYVLPLGQRIAYLGVGAVRAAPTLAIFLGLRRLFALYAKGEVFGGENARQIQMIGAWLVADAVIPFAEHLVQRAAGIEIDHSWAHMVSLQELVLGALVFIVAEVMRVGHEIERDREGFV